MSKGPSTVSPRFPSRVTSCPEPFCLLAQHDQDSVFRACDSLCNSSASLVGQANRILAGSGSPRETIMIRKSGSENMSQPDTNPRSVVSGRRYRLREISFKGIPNLACQIILQSCGETALDNSRPPAVPLESVCTSLALAALATLQLAPALQGCREPRCIAVVLAQPDAVTCFS